MLIVKDKKQWQRPRGVIRLDPLCERGEVSVYHLRERRLIQRAGRVEGGEVVDPKDVVGSSLADHPQQLPVELEVGDVREPVVIRERRARHAFEQGVELGLLVMFLGKEAILQRQPYETGIVPRLGRLAPLRFEDVGQALEHEQHVFNPVGWYETRFGHPAAEPSPRGDAEGLQGVIAFLAAQQGIVRNEHFGEQNPAAVAGQLLSGRCAAGGHGKRVLHLRVEESDFLLRAPNREVCAEVSEIASGAGECDGLAASILVEKRDHEPPQPRGRL